MTAQSTTNKTQKTNTNRYRDLEMRATEFAKRIIRLCRELPKNKINDRLIDQIIRSAVGAYRRS